MRREIQKKWKSNIQPPGIDDKALEIACKQFCMDICLSWRQYTREPQKKIYIQKMEYAPGSCYPKEAGARRVTGLDSFMKVILCMGKLFMGVDESIYDWAQKNYGECQPEWFCQYENLRQIDEKLHEHGRKILDTHIYYLPAKETRTENGECRNRADALKRHLGGAHKFPLCWYEQEEILALKSQNRFHSAICFSETQPDVLAVAAMKPLNAPIAQIMDSKPENEEEMIGMAGCSADSELLWQIGINVDEEYQGQGIATELVSLVKEEVIRRGKVPYYGTSESHTVSQTIAYRTGFVPAWTEVVVGKV